MLVDAKPDAVRIGRARSADAGLTNVEWFLGDLADYAEPFDVALATHLCGESTDVAQAMAIAAGAAFVLTPCCVGKIKHAVNRAMTNRARDAEHPSLAHGVQYPRSRWLRGRMHDASLYLDLIRLGDHNHQASEAGGNYAASASRRLFDADRLAAAAEAGYTTECGKLWPETASAKNDVLVGWVDTGSIGGRGRVRVHLSRGPTPCPCLTHLTHPHQACTKYASFLWG